jgi:hypothetical protein
MNPLTSVRSIDRALVSDYLRYAYTVPKGGAGNTAQGLVMRGELARTRRRWQRAERPVLIHTMGKVGSMAMAGAVHRAEIPGVEVFHTHRLIDHNDPGVKLERQGIAPRRTWYVSSALARCVAEQSKNVVVLSVVRDPLERNVSGFFQTIERYLPDRKPINPASPPPVDQLIEIFIERWPHQAITTWLDREISTHFDIDPYERPFDAESGFSLHRSATGSGVNNVVGIARHDRFPEAAESMLSAALGVDGISLTRRNATGDKHIAPLVERFKQDLSMPADIVDDLYRSRYATHFGFERP